MAAMRDRDDWPLYWFAKLEQAITEGDYTAAAEAQRQLRRLGVNVAYGRSCAQSPRPQTREAVSHAQ